MYADTLYFPTEIPLSDSLLSKDTVEKVAKLARLKLTENEIQNFAQQLSVVLNHFDEISKLDTVNFEPLVTPIEIKTMLRTDQEIRDVGVDELMKNSPEKSGHLFKVPQVVG